jgi:hypothetical protein
VNAGQLIFSVLALATLNVIATAGTLVRSKRVQEQNESWRM